VPPVPVGVLALPAVAPWMRISEAVDYLRAVAPRTALPIHFGIIQPAAQGIYFGRLAEMAPAGTEFKVIQAEDESDF
jgi:L-ascorbate metabolism protein UlaG (beta-lactamase superfamily)